MAGKGNIFVSRQSWAAATPRLIYACLVYSMGSVFFGKLAYSGFAMRQDLTNTQDSQLALTILNECNLTFVTVMVLLLLACKPLLLLHENSESSTKLKAFTPYLLHLHH